MAEGENPRRPVASEDRYTATQQHTNTIDATGRLGAIVALARYTGRREAAICQLRAQDVLRTPAQVREALTVAGMDENLAGHYPHGAIRWSSEIEKEGFLFITPISSAAREALDTYLQRSPRIGDVPLFPAPADPFKPISRDRASKWLRRAEVPKFSGGLGHPYRRLWATERQHLPDVAVAEARWRDLRALKTSYQRARGDDVAAVVNLEP